MMDALVLCGVLGGALLTTALVSAEEVQPPRPLASPLPTAEQGPGAWDRLDSSLFARRTRLRFDTLDGHRLKAFFYPAAPRPAETAGAANAPTPATFDRLIVVPDVYKEDIESLGPIIANLNRDFHVILMMPRGHLPSDRNYYGSRRMVDSLARSSETSAKFLGDYRSLIKLLDRTTALPGRKGRTCIMAGKFHSTVLLLDEVAGVDCLVLLSPNPRFYRKELTEQVSPKVKVPVLLVNDERTGFRLRPLEAKLPAARLKTYTMAGVGMAMLYRRPEIIQDIRAFLNKPDIAPTEKLEEQPAAPENDPGDAPETGQG